MQYLRSLLHAASSKERNHNYKRSSEQEDLRKGVAWQTCTANAILQYLASTSLIFQTLVDAHESLALADILISHGEASDFSPLLQVLEEARAHVCNGVGQLRKRLEEMAACLSICTNELLQADHAFSEFQHYSEKVESLAVQALHYEEHKSKANKRCASCSYKDMRFDPPDVRLKRNQDKMQEWYKIAKEAETKAEEQLKLCRLDMGELSTGISKVVGSVFEGLGIAVGLQQRIESSYLLPSDGRITVKISMHPHFEKAKGSTFEHEARLSPISPVCSEKVHVLQPKGSSTCGFMSVASPYLQDGKEQVRPLVQPHSPSEATPGESRHDIEDVHAIHRSDKIEKSGYTEDVVFNELRDFIDTAEIDSEFRMTEDVPVPECNDSAGKPYLEKSLTCMPENLEAICRKIEYKFRTASAILSEDLFDLNDAVFNVPVGSHIDSSSSSRLFWLMHQIHSRCESNAYDSSVFSDYLALLGTMQNQRFLSKHQESVLVGWIQKAIEGSVDEGFRGAPLEF